MKLRHFHNTPRLLIKTLLVSIFLLFPKLVIATDSFYSPYPIVFVHGVNSSEAETWEYMKGRIEKYFKDENGYKYFHNNEQNYFPSCDYEFMNNGDIRSIAWVLKSSIDKAIENLPEDQKKVIIVSHSMGGLAVRSLLKQKPEYEDKIDRVVFIGTPHLGAPSASALWILNKLNKSGIDELAAKYSRFYSASAFTGFRFRPVNYSPSVFSGVASKLINLKASIATLLKTAKTLGPDPDGIALEELRLAGDVNYHTSIVSFSPNQIIKEDISFGHSGDETFLGQNNLSIPLHYKTIRGVNPIGGKLVAWSTSQLIDNFGNNFTFPSGQSLEDAKNTGDGIVARASQEGIGSADYTVNAFHSSIPSLGIKGETKSEDSINAILQSLEDKPEIVSVRAVPVDWGANTTSPDKNKHYVIIKVKDYLLADIEVDSITLDGVPVTLPDNFKGTDDKYKPYNAFGKNFLTSREDSTAQYRNMSGSMADLSLESGEFWVKLDLANKNTISIKIKNAVTQFDADKFSTEKTLTISSPLTLTPKQWVPTVPAGGGLHWEPVSSHPTQPRGYYYLDIPPFDQTKAHYREVWEDGEYVRKVFYYNMYPEQLTLSFEVNYSPVSTVKFSLFTYINDGEFTEIDIIKRLITERTETLYSKGGSGEDPIYGKSFGNILSWNGSDDNDGYAYTSRINWTSAGWDSSFFFGYVYVVLVMEPTDNDPADDLLPLSCVYRETVSLEK